MLSYLKLYRINSLLTVIQSRLRHGPLGSCLGIYFPWNLARIKSFVFQPTSTLFLGKVSQMIIDGNWMLNVFIFPFLFSELILNLIASVVAMFYYPNPLLVPGGSVRFPSLELPFSSNQPCKFARSSKSSARQRLIWLYCRPRPQLPLGCARRDLPEEEAEAEQDDILPPTARGAGDSLQPDSLPRCLHQGGAGM